MKDDNVLLNIPPKPRTVVTNIPTNISKYPRYNCSKLLLKSAWFESPLRANKLISPSMNPPANKTNPMPIPNSEVVNPSSSTSGFPLKLGNSSLLLSSKNKFHSYMHPYQDQTLKRSG